MKAIVIEASGLEGISYTDIPKPGPRPGEVLIRVIASSVTRGDVALRKIPKAILVPMGWLFGFKPMKVPGVEYAGIVETVGSSNSMFKPGDAVFGTATGLAYGGNAEYLCVPEKPKTGVIQRKPASLSFQEAAVLPVGGMTALQNLARHSLKPGSSILVYGASGSVGSYALQLAAHFGATVTAVCGPASQDSVRQLGAARVLDYTKPEQLQNAGSHDAVFDAVGKLGKKRAQAFLKAGGTYSSIKAPTKETAADIKLLAELAGTGQVKALIEKSWPLSQAAEAHRHVEGGHKKGNVVIEVSVSTDSV